MSLDKSIAHGKERRKQYRGSKAIDKSCRNHGGCEWCLENRMYKNLKRLAAMKEREIVEQMPVTFVVDQDIPDDICFFRETLGES